MSLRDQTRRIAFRMRIVYTSVGQTVLASLERVIVPMLLASSFILIGVVLWKSWSWFALAGMIDVHSHTKDRIMAENEIMRTLSQLFGGAFVLAGVYFTAKNIFLSRRGQTADRFSTAVENLGDENIMRRIGGIHALESIAIDSPRDHWRIMEIFAQYVRVTTTDHSYRAETAGSTCPRIDVQQVLYAISRRNRGFKYGERRRLDLSGADIQGADLKGANLEGANLQRANLRHAILAQAHLKGANLDNANLEAASLVFSDLRNTIFYKATLERAQLRGAVIRKTSFVLANLRGASFDNTRITGALFVSALLQETSFVGAYLKHCEWHKAELSAAYLHNAIFYPPVHVGTSESQNTTTPTAADGIGESSS
jgi:Pentapeptide repeats (8 copies)